MPSVSAASVALERCFLGVRTLDAFGIGCWVLLGLCFISVVMSDPLWNLFVMVRGESALMDYFSFCE
jgi:hypothetical protein